MTPMAQVEVDQVFTNFKRQENMTEITTATGDDLDASLSRAFSSACACQTYQGSVVTETCTQDPVVSLATKPDLAMINRSSTQ